MELPYETVIPEQINIRADYQNDVFDEEVENVRDERAENLEEEGQYEELKEGELRKNEQEKPYSMLKRI